MQIMLSEESFNNSIILHHTQKKNDSMHIQFNWNLFSLNGVIVGVAVFSIRPITSLYIFVYHHFQQ